MSNICVIPVASGNINSMANYLAAAETASSYDEVIISYPVIFTSPRSIDLFNIDNTNLVRTMNRIWQAVGKPCWISLNPLWPHFNYTSPEIAYKYAIEASLREMSLFWGMLDAASKLLVKGFVFDRSDYFRKFGTNINIDPSDYKYYDRYYTNSLIEAAHQYNRPAMVITSHAADIVGNIYKSDSTSVPGAGKWPSLLGADSAMVDWLIVRDPFYTPASILAYVNNYQYLTDYIQITEVFYNGNPPTAQFSETETVGVEATAATPYLLNEEGFQIGPSANFLFNGANSTFWRFFSNVQLLESNQKSNLNVGFLQHIDLSANVSDNATGPAITVLQSTMLQNMFTYANLFDIDGFGVISLAATPYIPNVRITDTITLTVTRTGSTIAHSMNGQIYADFLAGSISCHVSTDQAFSFLHLDELT